MRIVRPVVLALLAGALAGCLGRGDPKVYGEDKPFPHTIVSLSPSSTEVLARWGPFSNLKGKTTSCNWPGFISNIPAVVDTTRPDYEKIVAMKADLVVYDPVLYSADEIAKIKALGIETLEWNPATIDDMIDQLYKMGSRTRSEVKAAEYADKIYVARAEAEAEALKPPPTVALVLPGNGTEHMIVGTRSFQADEFRAAGGEPVGPDSDRFETLNAEQFVTMNPDVIIVAGDVAAVLSDPRLASVSAVKNKRVDSINPDAAVRRGGRVDVYIRAVAAMLRKK